MPRRFCPGSTRSRERRRPPTKMFPGLAAGDVELSRDRPRGQGRELLDLCAASMLFATRRSTGSRLGAPLEHEAVVVEQLALEADAVGAHPGGEGEAEVGAGR